ncbi:MAG: DUF3574 domain-containing protein [Alphaproteobacteria bacterium]
MDALSSGTKLGIVRIPTLMLVLSLAGCAGLHGLCPTGLSRMTSAELIFGRNIATGGSVSDADWAQFLDTEVTPRFPDGLSVFDAQGQWRGPDGTLVREPSKLLLLVIKGTKDEQERIEAIRASYKVRFKQQSVLLVEHRECVSF